MYITQSNPRGTGILELHGNLVGRGVDLLVSSVRRAIQEEPETLVLNLRDVPSIDAAGIGALAFTFDLAIKAGMGFTLTHLGGRVRVLLTVCLLDFLCESYSPEEAIANIEDGHAAMTAMTS